MPRLAVAAVVQTLMGATMQAWLGALLTAARSLPALAASDSILEN